MRHFLDVDDVSAGELREILELAKQPLDVTAGLLNGRTVACYFEKPSTRTRNSTEVAVVQLGGHPVYLTDTEVGLGTREPVEDVTRVLAGYHELLCARVFAHSLLERMAALDLVPIVNLLSDVAHPLQAVADVLTIEANCGPVEQATVTYVGDSNNVARSLALAVAALGGRTQIVSPPSGQFGDVERQRLLAAGGEVEIFDNVSDIEESDVIYTDTWVSMGQENERLEKLQRFEGFQVDDALMASHPEAIFMHCLPAHRDEEVAATVIDGPQSKVWEQAENRLHAARAVLAWLMEAG